MRRGRSRYRPIALSACVACASASPSVFVSKEFWRDDGTAAAFQRERERFAVDNYECTHEMVAAAASRPLCLQARGYAPWDANAYEAELKLRGWGD